MKDLWRTRAVNTPGLLLLGAAVAFGGWYFSHSGEPKPTNEVTANAPATATRGASATPKSLHQQAVAKFQNPLEGQRSASVRQPARPATGLQESKAPSAPVQATPATPAPSAWINGQTGKMSQSQR